jgi:hypothetical protein
MGLWCLVSAVFIVSVCFLTDFKTAADRGDNHDYISIASGIMRWDFRGLEVKRFWGLPYAMAAVSRLTHLPLLWSLIAISVAASFAAVWLTHRLWGGWVAAIFTIISFEWIRRSLLGGTESLFQALVLGAALCVRSSKWLTAAVLASISVVVRPAGFILLLAIGIALLSARDFRRLAWAIGIGVAVGVLYVLPFGLYFHSPIANVLAYRDQDWASASPIGVPFQAIISGMFGMKLPWWSAIVDWSWILFVLIGMVALLAQPKMREYCRSHRVEAIFVLAYAAFLFAYNSPQWAGPNFARFALPIVPVLVLALLPWLPKSLQLLWVAGVVSGVLAAIPVTGVRNVFGIR